MSEKWIIKNINAIIAVKRFIRLIMSLTTVIVVNAEKSWIGKGHLVILSS